MVIESHPVMLTLSFLLTCSNDQNLLGTGRMHGDRTYYPLERTTIAGQILAGQPMLQILFAVRHPVRLHLPKGSNEWRLFCHSLIALAVTFKSFGVRLSRKCQNLGNFGSTITGKESSTKSSSLLGIVSRVLLNSRTHAIIN